MPITVMATDHHYVSAFGTMPTASGHAVLKTSIKKTLTITIQAMTILAISKTSVGTYNVDHNYTGHNYIGNKKNIRWHIQC